MRAPGWSAPFVVDAGFLELVRLGELPATDPVVANSLTVVAKTIKIQTTSGAGWLRWACRVLRRIT